MDAFDSQAACALRKAAGHYGLNDAASLALPKEISCFLRADAQRLTDLLLSDTARPLPLASALPLAFGYAFGKGLEASLLWQAGRLDDIWPVQAGELWQGRRYLVNDPALTALLALAFDGGLPFFTAFADWATNCDDSYCSAYFREELAVSLLFTALLGAGLGLRQQLRPAVLH